MPRDTPLAEEGVTRTTLQATASNECSPSVRAAGLRTHRLDAASPAVVQNLDHSHHHKHPYIYAMTNDGTKG